MKRSGLQVIAGGLVLLLIIAGIAAAAVWYKLAALKGELAQNLGDALGAKVTVSSLRLDFTHGELQAAGITLANLRPEAPWDRGEISQATVHFHLGDLFASSMPLSVDVSSWSVNLRPFAAGSPSGAASGPESSEAAPTENPGRRRVRVTELSARDGEVDIDLEPGRQVSIRGVSFNSNNNGAGAWTTQLQAETISAGVFQAGPGSVEIQADGERVTFSNLRLQCAPGAIAGDGFVALDPGHAASLNLKIVNVPVSMLVALEWQMKLSGLATGTVQYTNDAAGARAEGRMAVSGAKFNLLPFLDKITTLMSLPDFAATELDTATTDFAWKDHVLHLTGIDLRKNDVMRIAGDADIDAADQVDGRLKVGLPASFGARWPQLQSAVFSTSLEDYCWADVHVTGTPDHLQEDLTPRLLSTGLQTGGSLLNTGGQKAMDLLNNLLGRPSQGNP
jgi:hypothetical protein